jgi:predicted ATPase
MALIGGVAVRGFRSFPSSRLAIVFPLSKINLVVGQNNTGKSNVLRAVHNALTRTQAETSLFDRPTADAEYLPLTLFPYVLDELAQSPVLGRADRDQLRRFLGRPEFSLGIDGHVWVERSSNGLFSDQYLDALGPAVQQFAEANNLVRELSNGWSSDTASNVRDVLRAVSQAMPPLPPSVYIESNRAISVDSAEEPNLNGRSLKKRLLELQNPSYARLQDREVFMQIQEFVRTVIDDDTVTIDIPHDLSTVARQTMWQG